MAQKVLEERPDRDVVHPARQVLQAPCGEATDGRLLPVRCCAFLLSLCTEAHEVVRLTRSFEAHVGENDVENIGPTAGRFDSACTEVLGDEVVEVVGHHNVGVKAAESIGAEPLPGLLLATLCSAHVNEVVHETLELELHAAMLGEANEGVGAELLVLQLAAAEEDTHHLPHMAGEEGQVRVTGLDELVEDVHAALNRHQPLLGHALLRALLQVLSDLGELSRSH
mmetsp:Transcript_9779/g.39711  ORF Transcript_9779/g.39711 Transcript_9779/m.39711 type:complete len:225 (-) Transcript_9779:203-877(-)